jgi:peptidoglycan/xylan/chitin deacetylase (PgdA/CDA1 family)
MSLPVILAFHSVGEGPKPLSIPTEVFRRQIAALRDSGCTALTISELSARVSAGKVPERAVAITFDDGFRSTLESAKPILDEAGFVASAFPVTGFLGSTDHWPGGTGVERLMSAADLLRLRSAGWEIGGHTHTHRRLPALAAKDAFYEIQRSTEILEDLLGEPVRSFAYPYGEHNAGVRALAAATYDNCLTIGTERVAPGSRADSFPRVDAWYARRPWIVERLYSPAGAAYLRFRAVGRACGALLRRSAA